MCTYTFILLSSSHNCRYPKPSTDGNLTFMPFGAFVAKGNNLDAGLQKQAVYLAAPISLKALREPLSYKRDWDDSVSYAAAVLQPWGPTLGFWGCGKMTRLACMHECWSGGCRTLGATGTAPPSK